MGYEAQTTRGRRRTLFETQRQSEQARRLFALLRARCEAAFANRYFPEEFLRLLDCVTASRYEGYLPYSGSVVCGWELALFPIGQDYRTSPPLISNYPDVYTHAEMARKANISLDEQIVSGVIVYLGPNSNRVRLFLSHMSNIPDPQIVRLLTEEIVPFDFQYVRPSRYIGGLIVSESDQTSCFPNSEIFSYLTA